MKKSLTLIEVMVAALIFAILALSLYSLLKSASGIRNRLDTNDSFVCGSYLNLEVFSREIKNVIYFCRKNSGFKGQLKTLEFYTQNFDYANAAGYVAQITYMFKNGILEKSIIRPFGAEVKTFSFIENLNDIGFYYFNGATLEWQETWEDIKVLPKGLKIELAYKDKDKQLKKLTKYIWLAISK